jgi:hypothetical protein
MSEEVAEHSNGKTWGRNDPWFAIAVGVVAMLPFTPALWGPFIFDDRLLILANPYVKSLHQWPHWFTSHFWDAGLDEVPAFPLVYYRPLITASYAIDWKVGAGSPVAFHMSSLLWHGLCAVLAYVTARRWLRSVSMALCFTIIFAMHPTKAESVAWIAGRTDIFCTVGMLVVCGAVAIRRSGRHVLGTILEVVGTAFAYLSKETAVTLPILVAVETWFARGRRPITRTELLALMRASLAHVLIAGVYWMLRASLLPVTGRGSWNLDHWERVFLVFESVGRFAEMVLLPVRLSIQQGLLRVEAGNPIFHTPFVVAGGCVLAGLALVAWLAHIRCPSLTMGIALFVGTLLPTLNLVPTLMVTMVSERFLYLPTLAVALLVVEVVHGARVDRWARIGAVVLGVLYATRSAIRSHDYSDECRFWEREERVNPHSVQAIGELARIARDAGRLDDALALCHRGQHVANRWFPYLRAGPGFVLFAAELVGQHTPDADRDTLRALAVFFGNVARSTPSEPATVAFDHAHFVLSLPEETEGRRPYELRARRAEALCASRAGEDNVSVRAARWLISECPTCIGAVRDAALALARAGQYDEAFSALGALPGNRGAGTKSMIEAAERHRQTSATAVGPAFFVARAQELATLLAWGRAYDTLAPYRVQFRTTPEIGLPFGELAWRSGHFLVAREMLLEHMSEDEVAERTRKWSVEMGWASSVPATHGM